MNFNKAALFSSVFIALTPAVAQAISFTSTLNGAQENPPFDTDATGTAIGTLTGEPGSYVFDYEVSYSGLESVLAVPLAHIHFGARGENGPIIHDLDNAADFAGTTEGTIIGDWAFDDEEQPLTDAFADALLAGNLYFNLHTLNAPSGEIRGQIDPVSVPESSSVLSLLSLGALSLAFSLKKR